MMQKKLLSLCSASWLAVAGIYAQAPLYLNLGSHNETNDPYDYIGTAADYELVKSRLLQVADTVAKYGARWNMQVESNFIRGCMAHDTAASNPDNLLLWADNQPHIEVDPHNHFVAFPPNSPQFNPYNYTDLNALLTDSCGLSQRTNLGGFLWRDFTTPANVDEDWTQFQTPVSGHTFPLEQWQPQVIWGGGSPNHVDDFNTLGIWKPKAATPLEFGQHEPNNYLVCIGSNCGNQHAIFDTTTIAHVIQSVEAIIQQAQTQGNAATDFYTLTIMFNFRHINAAGMVDKIADFVRAMEPHAQQGKVVWATLTEKYNTWYSTHTNLDSFLLNCDDVSTAVPVPEPMQATDFQVYPNPAQQALYVATAHNLSAIPFELLEIGGKTVLSGTVAPHAAIPLYDLPNGVYYLRLRTEQHPTFISKIVIAR